MKTLILYHSKSGHAIEAFRPFIKSIEEEGTEAKVILAENFESKMIEEYDSIVVGTPSWDDNSNETSISLPLSNAIKSLAKDALKDKLCGGILFHTKYGEEPMLKHLKSLLESKGCQRFEHTTIAHTEELGSNNTVSEAEEEVLIDFGKELMLLQFSKL